MPKTECGVAFWRPQWLQRFANTRSFIIVYGFLGTVQAMSYMYFVITLTTIERRFKIPSRTTGIIMSGNEISQILLSLFLSYAGGQRNRPLWIAWGVAICGISCFILALPHFIYGAGEDALRLTKEYQDQFARDTSFTIKNSSNIFSSSSQRLCLTLDSEKSHECDELFTVVPLVLIFLSQFVLGIGNTLYYSLGQAYLDDNTKKTNTPQLLGYAFSLRMFGPLIGFFVAYAFLNMYIDPTKTPLITSSDPRWMGAWWMGWIVVGSIMMIFAVLIGMFPKDLPKKPKKRAVTNGDANPITEEALPLKGVSKVNPESPPENPQPPQIAQKAEMKDFPAALARLFRNKVIMFNIISGIFYILGASGYMTFFAKYIEVQFHKTRSDSTIIAGPINLFGMVAGFLISGWVITKQKPSASKLLFWNVFLGFIYIAGTAGYLFLTCPDENMPTPVDGRLNLTKACNGHCSCDDVPYNPICNEATGITYFSACHAGCVEWDADGKFYSNCSCLAKNAPKHVDISMTNKTYFKWTPPAHQPVIPAFPDDYDEITVEFTENSEENSTDTTTNFPSTTEETTTEDQEILSRRRRSTLEATVETLKAIPGACMAGCSQGFFLFALVSSITNFMGATGKIGNVLVNYRAVSVEDKSFTQGLVLMMFSLFGLIPGPILYGWIIDQTCMVWNYRCEKIGNCQIYNQRDFRYDVHLLFAVLTSLGMIFDTLVWYYGKNLDFYSEDYAETNQKQLKSKTRRKP
ncbi:solute carrier organic anion transporter family member 74D isoform X2 [Phlebotomus papatasi]|uniref:solute carrier organic anion transporter family member 74D isoform X2 n=1 Tax=Phlebotomus papatasi TaxID=29031 RepID=UPI002483873B|nr:solute carrier organic anion transporter family member 74D isoform X2 [Phlebotomus papatasi]